MKHPIIFTLVLLSVTASFAQTNSPAEVTPQVLQKIKSDVEKQAVKFKETLAAKDMTNDQVEFSVDTFKIGQIAGKRMEIDYSTAGMNNAVNEITSSYDKVMNKYYNKLLQMLKPNDKKFLVTAQRAWLAYRNAEAKLIVTITKEEYSGGGTLQSNIRNGLYSDVVVKRTLQLFNYYDSIIKNQ